MSQSPTYEPHVIGRTALNSTVVICDSQRKWIGTGFVVSFDGKILTCAHVIRDCLGKSHLEAGDATFEILFPKLKKWEKARLHASFSERKDDIALLKLTSSLSPVPKEQLPYLVSAEHSVGREHAFRSWGYCKPLGKQINPAKGIIDEIFLLIEEDKEDPFKIISQDVDSGMSGAAVFDVTLNAVVGIISRTVDVVNAKNRDTSEAVNIRVATFDPLNISLYNGTLPVPLEPAPIPTPSDKPMRVMGGEKWNGAPDVLNTWVGRDDLLAQLTQAHQANQYRVLGLIGFGGEGKTSLARKWVDTRLKTMTPAPDGVFWWSFYDNRSADAFFEALFTYFFGEDVAQTERGATHRMMRIADVIIRAQKQYLFILDGLEVMQNQEKVGAIESETLRDFLKHLALPSHQSLCLITSRLPITDLDNYLVTYHPIAVEHMKDEDAIRLLKEGGVIYTDETLLKVVKAWGGHALTLGLLATYIQETKPDIQAILSPDDPFYEKVSHDDDRYKHIKRILRRYDEHLSPAERAFMLMFCAFRLPVRQSAFATIFRTTTTATALNQPLTALDDTAFDQLVTRLVARRLINPSQTDEAKAYTAHPLIRAHYEKALTGYDGAQDHHKAVAGLYEAEAKGQPQKRLPTLDDLKPYIEMVHHLCRAGAYDKAFYFLRKELNRISENYLTHRLGAFETELEILVDFFPNNDAHQVLTHLDLNKQRFIYNAIGFCYSHLGKLHKAIDFIKRGNQIDIDTLHNWRNVSTGYQNLFEIYIYLGELDKANEIIKQSLAYVEQIDDEAKKRKSKRNSLGFQGWAEYLRGNTKNAERYFTISQRIQEKIDGENLSSLLGIFYADYLRRVGKSKNALVINENNFKVSKDHRWQNTISQCYRIFGDLAFDSGEYMTAHTHYDEAIRIVRMIDKVDVRIEALLARGRFFAKHLKKADWAFNDLNEAFDTAHNGEYRIYEADIRIALAWAHLAQGEVARASDEANTARQMSADMGYHWGVVDADAVLGEIQGQK